MAGPRTDHPEWQLNTTEQQTVLVLAGNWVTSEGGIRQFPPEGLRPARAGGPLVFQTAALGRWDMGLIRFLWELRQEAIRARLDFRSETLPEAARKLLDLLPDQLREQKARQRLSFTPIMNIGRKTIEGVTEIGTVSELGFDVMRGTLRVPFGGSRMRMTDLLANVRDAGPASLAIVSTVNFLIGAILAFVGAIQLKKFGADIYVANLVGIAMVREMSAVMTAIIMAGRTGGAYAARIATMQGNEEIDALTVIGIPVTSYLILPSALALLITMPLLYLYGCVVGIFGGYVVAIAMLDVTGTGYLDATFSAVEIDQFIFGFIKACVFALYIGLTSCRIGLQAGRSAADVGVAATRAVVVGIVGVIALDAIFAVIADAIGI